MRIFVMFGTQDKRFDRLLNAILNSHFVEENDVYVQLMKRFMVKNTIRKKN